MRDHHSSFSPLSINRIIYSYNNVYKYQGYLEQKKDGLKPGIYVTFSWDATTTIITRPAWQEKHSILFELGVLWSILSA